MRLSIIPRFKKVNITAANSRQSVSAAASLFDLQKLFTVRKYFKLTIFESAPKACLQPLAAMPLRNLTKLTKYH